MIELYRPSCGTEGADFMSRWCCRCVRDKAFREEDGDSCPIAAATMIYHIDQPEYPREWREDGPSGPRCTAFVAEGDEEPQDPAAAVHDLFAIAAAGFAQDRNGLGPKGGRAAPEEGHRPNSPSSHQRRGT